MPILLGSVLLRLRARTIFFNEFPCPFRKRKSFILFSYFPTRNHAVPASTCNSVCTYTTKSLILIAPYVYIYTRIIYSRYKEGKVKANEAKKS